MKILALLINGISLPHHVLDKTLQQAKNGKTFVKVVFVYENIDEKEYTIPKNIEISKADLSDSNAARSLEEVVRHNSSYVESNFIHNNLQYTIVVLKNPDIGKIAEALKDADKIFVDHDTFTHPDEFAYVNFSFEDLEEHIKTKIEWCKRD